MVRRAEENERVIIPTKQTLGEALKWDSASAWLLIAPDS